MAPLPPESFESLCRALEDYLEVASDFWREALPLRIRFAQARDTGSASGTLEGLRELLGRWERVRGAWHSVRRVAERVAPQLPQESASALDVHLERLQREFEEQATGLQVFLDLVRRLEASSHGDAPPELPRG